MRFFIPACAILFSTQSCNQIKHDAFLNKVMSDFSRNSYFVVLNVRSSKWATTSIIKNADLYYYFNKTRRYDESKYKSEVGLLIKENKYLTITDADFLSFGFTKNTASPHIVADARKGKNFVLNKYFKNQAIIGGFFTNDEKGTLIRALFDWSIPVSMDGETGTLVIETK